MEISSFETQYICNSDLGMCAEIVIDHKVPGEFYTGCIDIRIGYIGTSGAPNFYGKNTFRKYVKFIQEIEEYIKDIPVS